MSERASREWPVRLVRDGFTSPDPVLRPVVDQEEHLRLLEAKLVEEAIEAAREGAGVDELADVTEVLSALLWLRHERLISDRDVAYGEWEAGDLYNGAGDLSTLVAAAACAVAEPSSILRLALVWSAIREAAGHLGACADDVLIAAEEKRAQRGGFTNGLVHTIRTYDFEEERR